jgi:cytochrome c553
VADPRDRARANGVMSPIARGLDSTDDQAVALYYADLHARLPVAGAMADSSLVRAGEVVYVEGIADRGIQPCASCHGPDGRGTHPLFPSVTQPASYVQTQLRSWRTGGTGNDVGSVMGSVARGMSDEDIRAVSAYLAGRIASTDQ